LLSGVPLRLAVAAGILLLASGPVAADWLVELDGGDAMKVDSYRESGDRLHLIRDGTELSVPRARVRALTEVTGAGTRGTKQAPGAATARPPSVVRD
jgi:hypothetical protein